MLHKSRIPVIIATARPPRTVKYLLPEEIQAQAIMVYYNGAMIVSEELGLNQHFSIDSKLSSELIDYLTEMEREHCLSIEVEDNWIK
ncbi:HAD hydrolase family protein [Bacillus sp. FJAT-49732]|uniref:HAD hydrolase family protein n=1 Tax=Lederbergia citrisecunda TaxID=2833583 RepID=A0A942TNP5_9BACI|nr:HAD hydrolase family protein [Lederbergia citrisecunda]